MIHCSFEKRNGLFAAMRLEGHAGFARAGRDIVCAAVSAACDLTVHLAEEYFGTQPQVGIVDGAVTFSTTKESAAADKLLRGFDDYLQSIAQAHPECIKIEYTEV